jgi:hypothetical protein
VFIGLFDETGHVRFFDVRQSPRGTSRQRTPTPSAWRRFSTASMMPWSSGTPG